MRRQPQRLLPFALAALLTLGACGSDDDGADAAGDNEVASLDATTTVVDDGSRSGDNPTSTDTTAPANAPLSTESELSTDPEEAALDYAQCMRDHGIDMPDPEFTGDGGMVIANSDDGDGTDDGPTLNGPGDEDWDAANIECEPILETAESEFEPDPEAQAEMRERMLEFAECMREHGIDMPDPEFGDDGRVTMEMGTNDGHAVDDDEMQAAQEACSQDGAGGIAAGPPPLDESED